MAAPTTFFFYDLETSGFSPREARIMQFAGQRTDLQLKPIGEPVNELITMTPDILPDVDAILLTGITPQQTIAEGRTEADFLRLFEEHIATPGTIFVGYNTVRFDDEFVRFLHYRNFYDAYEWQWQDGRSRWDLLDLVRMTRALRPEGIAWPFDVHGKPSNRLELLTALNKIGHEHAHDALSDVEASIAVARMIRDHQPKLFEFLLSYRDKRKVAELVMTKEPFVYTSGKYPSQFEKTSVAVAVSEHPKKQGALVYDLRHDPAQFKDMSPTELADAWKWSRDETKLRLPVKALQFNHCPAIAPLGVLDEKSRGRLQLDLDAIKRHHKTLQSMKDFPGKLRKALELLDTQRQLEFASSEQAVDGQLYDDFFGNRDKQSMRVVRAAEPAEVGESLNLHFDDARLEALLPLYKARNFPKALTGEERAKWEAFCRQRLLGGGKQSRLAKYFARLQEVAERDNLTGHQKYLLEELKLYGESIMPIDEGGEEQL
ncbi:MAG TPA: exodeoxyribonuclease I [Candidatus Saccharimonadales bacterium]|nr:exodeoxyribonuclease I [Candidatus Saccharimonadales bacterium]